MTHEEWKAKYDRMRTERARKAARAKRDSTRALSGFTCTTRLYLETLVNLGPGSTTRKPGSRSDLWMQRSKAMDS